MERRRVCKKCITFSEEEAQTKKKKKKENDELF